MRCFVDGTSRCGPCRLEGGSRGGRETYTAHYREAGERIHSSNRRRHHRKGIASGKTVAHVGSGNMARNVSCYLCRGCPSPTAIHCGCAGSSRCCRARNRAQSRGPICTPRRSTWERQAAGISAKSHTSSNKSLRGIVRASGAGRASRRGPSCMRTRRTPVCLSTSTWLPREPRRCRARAGEAASRAASRRLR